MKIYRTIVATVLAGSIVGLGAGQAGAGADTTPYTTLYTALYTARSDPPPPEVGELAAPTGRQEATTCEGNVNCKILQGACDLVGGTYTGWDSRDHGHSHGICTWPWE